MKIKLIVIITVIITVFTIANACGSLKPPQECPFTGSADGSVFSQYFNRMVLVSEGAVIPQTGGDSEQTFSTNDNLQLVVISLTETQLQVCISERKGGGKTVYSQTHSLSKGENRLNLGAFKPNPFVIRIAVNNVLAKNVTFSIK